MRRARSARTHACSPGCSRAVPATARQKETPIVLTPLVGEEGIDTRGLDVSEEDMAELLRVETQEWKAQLPQLREHYAKFENLPQELQHQLGALGSGWARALPVGSGLVRAPVPQ
jgi:GTP-dependent phosphoenolpyruvate carboxykinase